MNKSNLFTKAFSSISDISEDFVIKFMSDISVLNKGNIKAFISTIFFSEEKVKNVLDILNIQINVPMNKINFEENINQDKAVISLLVVEDGSINKGKSPINAGKDIRKSGRGITFSEGIWLAGAYPSILDGHAIDLIETTFSKECIPTIYKWHNVVRLSALCPYVADSMCGAPYVIHEKQLSEKDIKNPRKIIDEIKSSIV